MPRPARAFTAESFELEGRLLLAAGSASTRTSLPVVKFVTPGPPQLGPFQVVTQQAGEATVTLSRSDTAGSLRVLVTTDPVPPSAGENVAAGDLLQPLVGVNVGAVDQMVTFADGQSQATLTVPILSGAPNPGEVDVDLFIWPVDPANSRTSLDLRILASDPTAPPEVVSEKVHLPRHHAGIQQTDEPGRRLRRE